MSEIHRKTLQHFDIDGEAHFLTFSCFRRLPLLRETHHCEIFLDALMLGRERKLFDLWAFVLMPEHVHLVLLPYPSIRVAQILKTVKQSVAQRVLQARDFRSAIPKSMLLDRQPNGKESYRFWQRGGGYDRNLRSLSDIYEKIEYVHNNPVRRGLAPTSCDWDWSSARAWAVGVDRPIPIDRRSLPTLTA